MSWVCKLSSAFYFQDDITFNVGLKLRMYSQGRSDVLSYDVSETCSYSRWASKEILCDRNYMEVRLYHLTLITCEITEQFQYFLSFRFLLRCQPTWLPPVHKLKLRMLKRRIPKSVASLVYAFKMSKCPLFS